MMSRPTTMPSQLHASRTGTARPPPQSLSTLSPSEMPPPSYERIQHVLLATAAAQHQQSQSQSQQCLSPFPPRRPLRHQLHSQLTHQQYEQRMRGFPTSPTTTTSFLAPAPPSAASANQPTTPAASRIQTVAGTLLENSWRGLIDRFNGELAHVHALYVNSLRKEQQEKEVFRGHCIRLKGERDVAREKLRRALGRQYDDGTNLPVAEGGSLGTGAVTKGGCDGAGPASSTGGVFPRGLTPPLSTSSTTSALFSSSGSQGADSSLFDSLVSPTEPSPPDPIDPHSSYPSPTPSSPSSPQLAPPPQSPVATFSLPVLSTPESSSPERGNSLDCMNNEPEEEVACADVRGEEQEQDRKRECDDESGTERPSKRRRKHHQCSTVLRKGGDFPEEPDMDVEHEQRNPGCSKINGDEEVKPSEESDGETSRSTTAEASTSSNSTRAVSPGVARNRLSTNHIDLMYMPLEDKLVCRVCAYRHGHARSTTGAAPKMFMRSATWEELTDHCQRQHPAACEEVAGMGPGEVMELRQRMMVASTVTGALVGR